jgi:hypothetical protein
MRLRQFRDARLTCTTARLGSGLSRDALSATLGGYATGGAMSSDERWFLSHLRELGEAECLELWTTTMSEEWRTATTSGQSRCR